MNDGGGKLAQDEDVEYLEQLVCEQIRTAHDAGFQRLQQSLQDAINGLEKARKDLNDLVTLDFEKALKKLVKTVPDEVGQVVSQVVKERLPGDYVELVKDTRELCSKMKIEMNEAFPRVDERIESAVAQISKLNGILAKIDIMLQEHISAWKHQTEYLTNLAGKTHEVLFALVLVLAMIILGVPVCGALWWWFQH